MDRDEIITGDRVWGARRIQIETFNRLMAGVALAISSLWLGWWAAVVALTGYVGLASMTAAASLPLWLGITRLPEDQPLFIYSVAMAMFIIYCHRANIQRMRNGVENRYTKLMLFGRRGANTTDDAA